MESLIDEAEDGNVSKVAELLSSIKDEEIIDVIQKRLCKEKGDAVTALRTVLQAAASASEKRKICTALYKRCIEILEKK